MLWCVAEIVHAKVGERVWLTWLSDEFHENFRIAEVDRCIAGSREARENDKPPVGTLTVMSLCKRFISFTVFLHLYSKIMNIHGVP